jgi:hypothetical protein
VHNEGLHQLVFHITDSEWGLSQLGFLSPEAKRGLNQLVPYTLVYTISYYPCLCPSEVLTNWSPLHSIPSEV